jgi:hypothetical protein
MRPGKVLVVFMVFILACGGGMQFVYDYNPKHSFTLYKTYDFLKDTDSTGVSVLDRKTIDFLETEIADNILDLGLFQELSNPELIIYYEASITGRQINSSRGSKYADAFSSGYSYATGDQSNFENREGTLSVYFYDRAERQIVWKGSAYGVLGKNREENMQMVAKAIDELFANYPGAKQ